MGQYHSLFNLDKLETVSPHALGFGAKQHEHSGYGGGSLADVLYVLTAYKQARGGGDWKDDTEIGVFKGRWHGDRVAVIGDYYEETDLPNEWIDALQNSRFKDITDEIRPFVDKMFNEDGDKDYRPTMEKLSDKLGLDLTLFQKPHTST